MSELEFGAIPVEPEFWFLEAGLYHHENYKFDKCMEHGFDSYRENLLSVIFPKITIDVYCPSCKRETVFVPAEREVDWFREDKEPVVKYGVHYSHFKCSRKHCGNDLYYVFTFTKSGVITKIGQFPSIADLIKPEIKKYNSVLEPEVIADWQRAIGLRAHGVGAGSYVYLRRIIENMVSEAAKAAISNKDLAQEAYERARWPERIKMLSAYLPEYLVKNAKVYSVLSKGVHELTEDECTDYFDVMHTSIEIICEEKLAEKERNEKAAQGSKALQKVLQKLSNEEA